MNEGFKSAILQENIKASEEILKYVSMANISSADAYELMINAIDTQNLKIFDLLLANDFNPNSTDNSGKSILKELINRYNNFYDIQDVGCQKKSKKAHKFYIGAIKSLLKTGADPNSQMLLHHVINKSNIEILKIMLDPGICKVKLDINIVDSRKNTALHIASKKANVDIVKILLKTDIKLDCINKEGHTALDSAKLQQTLSGSLIDETKQKIDHVKSAPRIVEHDSLNGLKILQKSYIESKKKIDNVVQFLEKATLKKEKKPKKSSKKSWKKPDNSSKAVMVFSIILLTHGIAIFALIFTTNAEKKYLAIAVVIMCVSLILLGTSILDNLTASDKSNKIEDNTGNCLEIVQINNIPVEQICIAKNDSIKT